MKKKDFLALLEERNDLSAIARAEISADLKAHPERAKIYNQYSKLAGNAPEYSINQIKTKVSNLNNHQVLFLGSSVTFGFGSLGESFVDFLWKRDGLKAIKDAENGTTLVNIDAFTAGDSYVARFQSDLKDPAPEVVVLQLSTNDVRRGSKKLGEISDNHYDTKTITGAIEYILAEIKLLWQCPVIIFTNPDFGEPLYGKMVDRTLELKKKWKFELINLYHDPDFKNQPSLYMADPIHPTRAGYRDKWLPIFEQKLEKVLLKDS
ncbi:lysophospholipase L1-like esterase [Lactobacillus colini]|uniref:Lysophospholipase L1-like esterase n=1 Tax=Lactobacillus colini TaxID=1819254 RepID=A0ABS4MG44_9LACO|nr:SGNH/GDSL hydrolase family protein [Lactobacillus colini]MBP2058662.1 lysophospholipase L1-like esterase [Lactobacillus colini]